MKKILAVLLAVILVASLTTVAASAYSTFDEGAITTDQAIKEYEELEGITVPTYRYYFLEPNGKNGPLGDDPTSEFYGKFAPSWLDTTSGQDFTRGGVGIYWWDAPGVPNPGGWTGYKAHQLEGFDDVWYADVPAPIYADEDKWELISGVTTIIWNNGVDGGTDETQDIFHYRAQSIDANSEYIDPGDNPMIQESVDSMNNMIWVADPDILQINPYSEAQTNGGYWWYYYGGSCFGAVKDGAEDLEHCCLNAAHDHSKPAYVLGDADKNQLVDIVDATTIKSWLAQLITDDKIDTLAADTDKNGITDIVDATNIQKALAKLTNLDGTVPYDENNPINPK